tara:strand:+ start:221 stop:454 length:234 start_codon:yes stop_codon:yes gene_type:complete
MIHKLDNTSIILVILISGIIPAILMYENKNDTKTPPKSTQYYIQWFVITFALIIFSISTLNERSKVENNIIVGTPNF